MVKLSQADIDRIVDGVSGGASNVQDIYPLAPLQEGLLFHHLIAAKGDPYLMPVLLAFDTRARFEGFLGALRAVIARHDILRTAVVWEGLQEPRQVVWREAPLSVEEVSLDPAAGDIAEQLRARFDPRQYRLDVRRAPLMRGFAAHDAAKERWLLLVLIHHLIADHSTDEYLVDEARAHLLGEEDRLPAPLPFRNFVAQARLGVSEAEHEAFFRAMLGGVTEPTAPFGLMDVQGDGSGIEEARLDLDAALARRLRARARALGVSAASLCHQAFAQLLARVSGRADVVFGTVLFGRMHGAEGADRALGIFINTLPVRAQAGAESVANSVRHMHEQLVALLRHEHASLVLAQRCSSVAAPAPLFSALLNYRHSPAQGEASGQTALAWDGIDVLHAEERTNYPLTLSVDDLGEGFQLTAQVQRPLDPDRVCAFMRVALERLVETLETAPETATRTIDVLPEAERRQMLVEWNDTAVDYPRDRLLHELFEEQVGRAPEAIAVVFEDTHLTYGELNGRANRLAHHLRERGVGPDVIVGICVERSLEMMVGLLGILKAGGAYLPLDPDYPRERLAYMLADAAPVLVLTQEALRERLPETSAALCLDKDWPSIGGASQSNPTPRATPQNLAYVIYTSGSTGRPKGVAIAHRGVVNRIEWMQAMYRLSIADKVLQKTPYGFDVSVWEFFWPLRVGARLVLARPDDHREPARLMEIIERERVTTLHFVPPMLQAFLNTSDLPALGTVRRVLCSGEALPTDLRDQFHSTQSAELHNLYGPTEASIDVTAYACESGGTEQIIPIGRPIWNTEIYLLDDHLLPVPIGVSGELYIGGVGLARGYLGRPGLTAERFVPDPFGGAGERLYRTGDLARYRPDGNIEFLGRIDHQVKIRGFRIELGEIEAALARVPGVREAVVLAREDSHGEKRLVAYVVVRQRGSDLSAVDLRAALQLHLPDYMVPSAFVMLEALPRTANGKIDRNALPSPDIGAQLAHQYVAPRTPTEEMLCRIWAEVLGLDRVGIEDNFFELGGHSLLAVQVISRIRREFERELPLRNLFTSPTVAAFAKVMDVVGTDTENVVLPEILPASRREALPLSFAQQRLWFLDQFRPGDTSYNIPAALRLIGDLDVAAFGFAVNEIVRRHEVLRTTFVMCDGEARQEIAPALEIAVPVVDLSVLDWEARKTEARRLAGEEARQPFDLAAGPLLRVMLLDLGPCPATGEREHVVAFTLHHIVSDGWSADILIGEFVALYEAFVARRPSLLEDLSLQYADYAVWQRDWLQGEVLNEQLAYWRDKLAGAPPMLELPTDRSRPAVQDHSGAAYNFEVPKDITERLQRLGRREGATLFMVLLAGFQLLLSRHSGQTDICVGTPVANRRRLELEGLIGFFVNTLVLRTDLSGDPSFRVLLARVREMALGAQAHQDLPFERLVEALQPVRDMSRDPLFQVMFVLQNTTVRERTLSRLRVEPVAMEGGSATFDLTLEFTETGEGLSASIEYATALFDAHTIERLAWHYCTLLEAVVADPETRISELAMLSAAERRQMLVEWNDTAVDYPRDRLLHELFEEQVGRAPEAIAVVFEDRHLTYGELNARANRLAHHLRERGVGPDVIVGICVERSLEMMVGLLGILKAGGAYLPLDPDYPRERLAYMLADAAPVLVLTQEALRERLPETSAALCLDKDWPSIGGASLSNPTPRATSQNLAYVIYTSGSTGRPKGVMIPNQGLINYLRASAAAYPVNIGEAAPVQSSIGFDATITSLVLPLLHGKQVILCPKTKEVEHLAKLIRSGSSLSIVKIAPAHLSALNLLLGAVDIVHAPCALILGGEALSHELLKPWIDHAPRCRLINEYGPTETVVGCCIREVTVDEQVQRDGTVPIGRPIWNTRIYLLDAHLCPVPIGVSGELYIGGAGLARGYLGRPDLTAERFVPDPFGGAGERLYRTGDLARYRPDGNIEFLGRIDHQVKIRGFRIELGEIETAICRVPGVREAVVLAREDSPGEKRLVAYVAPDTARLKAARRDEDAGEGDERVGKWETLFDETYGADDIGNGPSFVGWNSSYTGAPILEAEMQEWLQCTISRIGSLQPERLLEIGCGVGLLLQHLAPACRVYRGTDISGLAITRLRRWLETQERFRHVELVKGHAAEIVNIEAGSFDTVVLNSVVQYFPNVEYLLGVLEGAVNLVSPGGRVFVGDVRHLGLLPVFHSSVQLDQAPAGLSIDQLKNRIDGAVEREKELVIDPDFFLALQEHLPRIGAVEILLKRGRSNNELTRYRYDVALHVGNLIASVPQQSFEWKEGENSFAEFAARLSEQHPSAVSIGGVPNRRLARDLAAVRLLGTVGRSSDTEGLRDDLDSGESVGEDPEAFWALGERLGYEVRISWTSDLSEGQFDVLFVDPAELANGKAPTYHRPVTMLRPWSAYANDPLAATLRQRLGSELREILQTQLPEYMVPSAFVMLEALPLTANGKVDRKALPSPDIGAQLAHQYVAPRTPTEAALCRIWAEVLGLDRVGIEDNFFELGGHSLLAMTLIERMRRQGLQTDVRALFASPTPAGLAAAMRSGPLVVVPPNLIPSGCDTITSEMLPLVELSQADIDRIAGGVPGGASNVQDIYPLAPLQEGILFHHLIAAKGDPYLASALLAFDTRARFEGFLGALRAVIARHDILRTAVVWEGLPEPVQVVWREAPLSVEEVSLDPAAGDIAEQLRARFDARQYRLDVRRAPLLHGFLACDAAKERWLLLLLVHHLALDHTTLEILVEEAQAHLLGEEDRLPAPLPFRNFVAQARLGVSEAEHEAFFRAMLGGVTEPTAPFGLMDVQGDGSGIEEARLDLDAALARRLRARARALGVSAASLCHQAFAQLLARVSGRADVVFGTVLFGRMHGAEGADRALGIFINTLPVRAQAGAESVANSVRHMHEQLVALLRHEHASLVLAQRCSSVAAPAPLFSALLNYRHSPAQGGASGQTALAWDGIDVLHGEERTNYPLTLSVDDLGEGFQLTAQVQRPLDPDRVCAFMRVALERLVETLETAPETATRTIDVLPEAERRQMLVEWNDTAVDYPRDRLLHELFEEQVGRAPEAVAVVFEDTHLTYAELNGRANRLAHHLRERGVGPDVIVGICVERSLEMMVGLLGILKAGGAYLPLDPDYPRERLAYMLADAAPVLVLTQEALRERLPETSAALCLDKDWPSIGGASQSNPAPRATPQNLAYVIYTSGSTGTPKGVAVAHHNTVAMLYWARETFPPEHLAGMLAATSLGFDLSVFELFLPLCEGGKVFVVKNVLELSALGHANQITLVNTVPSAMAELLRLQGVPASIRIINLAGEPLQQSLVQALNSQEGLDSVFNLYGPTECTTYSSFALMTKHDQRIPAIGRPIWNTQIYLLDDHLLPVPIGVAGELYIGGAGLARGYLGRPDLTAERFVPDPFGGAGERLYRTGDLACYRPDGNIEFLGRIDHQVKIRGFRIELGEIEAALARVPGVREAVVLAREDSPGEKRLVAYVVGSDGTEPAAAALRMALQRDLPDHMVPSAFVMLEALPLTANGKIDRKALPSPDIGAQLAHQYVAPRTPTEAALCRIWTEVLGLDRVGIEDNFFELGGHSLLAVTLIERMRRQGLQTDVRALFASPTPAGLAAAMRSGPLVVVPPNLIPSGCDTITSEMLPLVELSQADIDRIAGGVPGGASNVQDIYPLAPLQEGLLFHHLIAAKGDPYLMPVLLAFDTRARFEGFLGALRAVIARHDILRTAVVWEGLPEPVQVVWREAPLSVEEVSLDPAAGDIAEQLRARFDARQYRLDVRRAPLLHGFLACDAAKERWLLLLLVHHLALDHTTLEILVEEAQAHLLGEEDRLPAPLPFRNFVAQARLGVSEAEHEAFFRAMLGGVTEPTAPFGLMDVQGDGSGIEEARLDLDAALARRLRARARALGVSAASLCHQAFAQLLARVSGRADVVFGTVLFGRMHGAEGADRALGIFINTLPVRAQAGAESVANSVRHMHEQLVALLRHEHASLVLAQRCSSVAAPAPLFSALLNYRHSPAQGEASGQTALAWEGMETLHAEERTNYPLTLSVDDLGEGFQLTAQVQRPLDPDRVCAFMRVALERLVETLETAPETATRTIDVLPEAERRQMLVEWNDTAVDYPRDRLLHELFEEQVGRAPEAVAVVFEDTHLTYAELNGRANRLAHHLRERGVGPDVIVGICVERSLEMMVGLLGILKAGGAYLPLDPDYPRERLAYMLADAAPVLVLTQEALRERLPETSAALCLDKDWPSIGGASQSNPAPRATPQNLAYVIYTSGSTGRPKGVAIAHRGVVNLTLAQANVFKLNTKDRVLQLGSISFDLATEEIFPTLVSGATLVLCPERVRDSWPEFVNFAAGAGLTFFNLTTAFWHHLTAWLAEASAAPPECLRLVCVGGEKASTECSRLWRMLVTNRVAWINSYGPTEATVTATIFEMEGESNESFDLLPIGRPIWNTQIYLLDDHLLPVPIGVAGELYIGGAGLARGYLGRPDLTAERFVPDPFGGAGERLYRTGDLACYRPDGNIEFLGRIDHQVKIRGFRIELGEIEAALARVPGVREAVVLAREDSPGEKRLVAYVVGSDGTEPAAAALRMALQRDLPDHMVPSAFVMLEALPLTANGKIDRKALPSPDIGAQLAHQYVAPRTPTEAALCRIWAEVLGLDRVGIEDNFFELGGHSLLAVTLIERMRRQGLQTDVRALFASPTPAGLAAAMRSGPLVVVPPNLIPSGCDTITSEMLPLVELSQADIDRIAGGVPGGASNVQDIYPLAPLQEGLLFHHLIAAKGDPYLMPVLLAFDTRARFEGFLGALRAVIARHDILRTAVVWEGLPEPVQVVWREAPLSVEEVSLDPAAGDIAEQLRARFDARQYRLDVRRAPLMRGFAAHDAAKERWLLLVLIHHLIADHSTDEYLVDEARAHLLGEEDRLPAPLPFRNFVAQARLGVSEAEHEAFFRAMLGGVTEPTAPFGLMDVQGDGSGIEEARLDLDAALARRLRARARALGVSAASLCHQAFAQLLARVSGRADVVFGTVLFGRMHGAEGADRALGIFINTLPVRAQAGAESVANSVRHMHEQLVALLRHEHASLVLAQRCSSVAAPAPLFSALLNYRHSPAQGEASGQTALAWDGIDVLHAEERTNYPLTLSVDDLGEGFQLTAQVQRPLDPDRVCAFMRVALERLVETLETAPETATRTIDVLPEAERRQMLVEWNDTAVDYPRDRLLHELFEEQVGRAPEAVAVVFEDTHLTYAELNGRANRLAHHLRERGVGPDVIVGICVERSLEMMVGLLGILKAGGAYLPLDPDYPRERLAYMLADAAPVLVLTQEALRERLPETSAALCLDKDWPSIGGASQSNPAPRATPQNLAYVIYTSGSTGRPKGVAIIHQGVVRLVKNTNYVRFDSPGETVLHCAPLAFDASTFEIWGPLLNGARLIIAPASASFSLDELGHVVKDHGVTTLWLTAALFHSMIDHSLHDLAGVKQMLAGGDIISPPHAQAFCEAFPANVLINGYGPTENTTFSTFYVISGLAKASSLSIGKPITNSRAYLLDNHLLPVPIGVSGELYIGGAGLARGYLGRPDLTAERFVPDPFGGAGERLYRTGDLACYRLDGNIEFLGRIDHQVKIRGFRIELGEIEAALARVPGVREAVVLAREDSPGEKRLVAYVVGSDGTEPAAAALRMALQRDLPDHMVPSAFVMLEALPLTANGKIDRKALPSPDIGAQLAHQYVAPRTPTEAALCRIWTEVLGLDRVGIEDNFFELGGHSLLAMTLIERMRRQGLQTDVRALFASPTPAGLAAAMRSGPLVVVPPNLIPSGCDTITSEMLPLVELSQADIDRIAGGVPGGASNVQDIYPLAPLQEGLLFHHLIAAKGDPYLMPVLLAFDTRARFEGFLGALRAVIARHDILRTAVVWEGLPEPVQVVWREAPLSVEEVSLDPAAGDIAEQLRARFDARQYRLDVRRAPLLHGFLACDAAKERWLLLLLVHHLALDHTTLEILVEEAQAHLLGEEDRLPAPLPFRNFVAQARLGVSEAEHEAFFRAMLGGVTEPTAPFGLMDVQGDGSGIEEARLDLDAALARRLRARARALGVSAASLCHQAFAQLLARVSGRADVVFGTVLFGRMHGAEGADRALGIFINTLPVRAQAGAESVANSVRHMHEQLVALLRHEHASLVLAQRCSSVAAPAPLFSALLNYRHSPAQGEASGQTALAWEGMETLHAEERTNYPLTLSVDDLGEGFQLTAQVQRPLDPDRVCAFMRVALERLVETLETAPETATRTIDVLPEAERRQMLVEWNDTAVDYPRDRLLHELFEEQVGRAPEAVAVVFEDTHLTYAELNGRANRLAHHLRERGVGPDVIVGICVERSLEMMVGLLGILKAGGAYLPLDPDYPRERLAYMLADAAPVLVLTQEALRERLPETSAALCLDKDWPSIGGASQSNPTPRATPQNLAYVIYTSGSTGTPKGVAVAHHNTVAMLYWARETFPPEHLAGMLAATSLGFDLSVFELFLPLCEGGKVFVVKNVLELSALGHANQITLVNTVPSAMAELLRLQGVPASIRIINLAGEPLQQSLVQALNSQEGLDSVFNLYGPTECTTYSSFALMTKHDQRIPAIGRPIWNTQIYLLDDHLLPVPIGVAGELYIGGAGLARGYLGRPDLTAERFVPDPFGGAGERLYRTGDLACYRPDGNIEFLGRIDHQVKIRGFRIELGEIEAALARVPGVREAVVLAREDSPGEKRLVAYVVGSDGTEPAAAALRMALQRDLPDHMVPSAFVMLEALPLTANGKIDRKALPSPDIGAQLAHQYVAPRTPTEAALCRIWTEVLGLDRVGIEDNFFELGGHSLLAVTLIERMRRQGLQTDVRALFASPTPAGLAAAMRSGPLVVVPPNLIPSGCDTITSEMLPLVELSQADIDRIAGGVPGGASNVQDIYPLAPLQEGLLFHHLIAAKGDPYLMPVLLAFDTRARFEGFLGALRAVIARHDILRTAVVWEGLPEPVQVVWREAPLSVEEVSLDPAAGDIAEQLRARFDARQYRLDVRRAPLLHGFLACDAAKERWLLLLLVHHLALDHTTLEILVDEARAHLLGEEDRLPAPLPFRNFVAQARLGVSEAEHEAFFRAMLGGVTEPTAPFGLMDVQGDGSGIEEARLDLDAALARRLRARARALGVSAASLCHQAFAQLLARVSGRADVVFGTVLFGRMHGAEGADRALGIFINTLPVRAQAGAESVANSVRHMHEQLVALLRHEHASLVLAQRCSSVAAPAPLFSALLNYRHSPAQGEASGQTALAWEGMETLHAEERTNYPLTLSVDDLGEGFQLTAQVQRPLDPDRVCAFMRVALERLVETLETAPETATRTIDVLPEAERRQMLVEWNDTAVDYPRDRLLHELFEEQVGRAPEAVAVVFEDTHLTYAELNGRANRLAHHLRERGVGPDVIVGICVERSLEMMVGLLGILKAGGAYLPLDPDYPRERLAYMLADAAPVLVLTQEALRERLPETSAALCLDKDWPSIGGASQSNPAPRATPQNLAYVIYTSGSTGRPKGVAIIHQGVVRLVKNTNYVRFDSPGETVLHCAPLAFDASTFEIWGPLLNGARLIIAPASASFSLDELGHVVKDHGVTTLWLTAALFHSMIDHSLHDLAGVKQMLAGGDIISPPHAQAFCEAFPANVLINGYGPTENTTFSTFYVISGLAKASSLSIGKPITNSRAYLLDNHLLPVPIGVSGELYIGGAGLARGYLGRPDLTAERFVPDPFGGAGERLYRTGDLACYRPDGNIEFLGRIDHQVKIRGFRIELGEIEAALARVPGVREAVVLAREDSPGEKRLVAYVVGSDGTEPAAAALRMALQRDLPDHMVPSAFVMLEALPLTANGKIDRKALPSPDIGAQLAHQYVAPRTPTEAALCRIWAEVLGLDRVGIEDNFFELGGHSLLALRLISRIHNVMGIVVSLRSFYEATTLSKLIDTLELLSELNLHERHSMTASSLMQEEFEI